MGTHESKIGDILVSTEVDIEVHADGSGAVLLALLERPHPLVEAVLEGWPYHTVGMSHMAIVGGERLMLVLDDVTAAANAVDWLWADAGGQGCPLDQIVDRARQLEAAADRAASEVIGVLERRRLA